MNVFALCVLSLHFPVFVGAYALVYVSVFACLHLSILSAYLSQSTVLACRSLLLDGLFLSPDLPDCHV